MARCFHCCIHLNTFEFLVFYCDHYTAMRFHSYPDFSVWNHKLADVAYFDKVGQQVLWEESQIWYGTASRWHRCGFPISYTCVQLVSLFPFPFHLSHLNSFWTLVLKIDILLNHYTGILLHFFMHTHAFPLPKQQDRLLAQFCRTLLIREFCLHCWCVITRFVQFAAMTSIFILTPFDIFILLYWVHAYLVWCNIFPIIVTSENSLGATWTF